MKHKKLVALTLSAAMTLSMTVLPANAADFSDVADHWGEKAIERWADYGVVQGSDGAFRPDADMTRGEMAAVLSRLLGLTQTAENTFPDLDADAWYTADVLKCVSAGILQGDGTNVNPQGTVTRQEAAVMLARALGIQPVEGDSSFNDAGTVADWASGYVNALSERGIINGVGGGNFAPESEINRASLVTILDNSISGYANQPGATIEATGTGITLVAAANVTVTGAAEDILVAAGAAGGTVTLSDVQVSGTVTVEADRTAMDLTGTTSVSNLELTERASSTTVTVAEAAAVGTVSNEAANIALTGAGKVDKVVTTTDSVRVETEGTELVLPDQGGEPSVPSQPEGGASSGGSSSGGSSSDEEDDTSYNTVSFETLDGTVIATANVANGNTATAPTSGLPVVGEGEKLTWYVKNGEPFDLSTPIQNNLQLVAVVGSSAFASGNGTQVYPYRITNTSELQGMATLSEAMKTTGYVFRLDADLDLNGIPGEDWGYVTNYFQGVFDGNGHTLTADRTNRGYLINYTIGDATVKDLTIVQNEVFFGVMATANYVAGATGHVTVENITAKSAEGTVAQMSNNDSSFITFMASHPDSSVTFRNCVNEADLHLTGNYAGIFLGGYMGGAKNLTEGTIVFDGCRNTGTVQGPYIGFFTGNENDKPDASKITIQNCVNEGVLLATKGVNWFAVNLGGTDPGTVGANELAAGLAVNNGTMQVLEKLEVTLTVGADGVLTPTANTEAATRFEISVYAQNSYTNAGVSAGSSYVWLNEDVLPGESTAVLTKLDKIVGASLYEEQDIQWDEVADREIYCNARYVVRDGIMVVHEQDMIDGFNNTADSVKLNSAPRYRVNVYAGDSLLGTADFTNATLTAGE